MVMSSPLFVLAIQRFYIICSWWAFPFHLSANDKTRLSQMQKRNAKAVENIFSIWLNIFLRKSICEKNLLHLYENLESIILTTKWNCNTVLLLHAVIKMSQINQVTCYFIIFFTYNNIEVH